MKKLQPFSSLLALLLGTTLVAGCSSPPGSTSPARPLADAPAQTATQTPGASTQDSSRAWLDAELTDVSSGKKFRLSDFKGRPVLLHAFAVW